MNIIKVLIEFFVTFLFVFLIYYVVVLRKCKKNSKIAPPEVNLILSFYEIDVNKINLYQMIKLVSLVTSFIIASIITIISIYFDSTIILLIFGTLISILVAIIIYRIIGRYYEKQSKKDIKQEK